MLKPGLVLDVEVQDLARGGAGVSRAEGRRVLFVPYTMPGDRVRVRVREVAKRHAQAELLEVLEPGPGRVEPRCPAFGRCGGCQWQHVPYPQQWRTKVEGVQQALRRIAVVLEQPPEEYPAGEVWEYRNRIQLRGRGREVGFLAAHSHELVPVERCDLARPEINARFDEARNLGERVGGSYKVELEVVEGDRVRMLWNSPHAAGGFRQVHDGQNRALQGWLVEALAEGGAELFDLFGGSANFSRELVGTFARVHCVDSAAPRPRPRGAPEALEFYRQDVFDWLERRSRAAASPEPRAAILDPPRKGLGKKGPRVAQVLRDMGVGPVVLVGCDPDAWTRDISAFMGAGWDIRRTALFDFFPQTKHVESVALLGR